MGYHSLPTALTGNGKVSLAEGVNCELMGWLVMSYGLFSEDNGI